MTVTIDNERIPSAEVVACPTCFAPPGERCAMAHAAQNSGYSSAPLIDGTHWRRVEAARIAADWQKLAVTQ